MSRRVLLIVLDLATGDTHEGVVSLTSGELEEWVQVPTAAPPYGQAPIMLEDSRWWSSRAGRRRWREAIAKRGVEDVESVFVGPPCPPTVSGTRRSRPAHPPPLSFLGTHATDSPWAHPVEGLIAHVDIIEKKVIKLNDTVWCVPTERDNSTRPTSARRAPPSSRSRSPSRKDRASRRGQRGHLAELEAARHPRPP